MRWPSPTSRRPRDGDAGVGNDSAEQIGAGCAPGEEREKMGVGVEALNTYCNNPAEDNRRITAGREDSGMNRRGRGRSLITNGEEIKPLIKYGM